MTAPRPGPARAWLGRRRLAIGCAVAAALATAAGAAASTQPLAGIYQGTVNGTSPHNASAGCFTQKPTVFGKRVKPASGHGTRCRDQIIAPSIGPLRGARRGCNPNPAVLPTGGFPIRNAGFHFKGHAPIGRHGKRLKVDFRGTWKTRTKVVGTTTVSGGGCKSTSSWTMRTPPSS